MGPERDMDAHNGGSKFSTGGSGPDLHHFDYSFK
jgi:hypothetical protein